MVDTEVVMSPPWRVFCNIVITESAVKQKTEKSRKHRQTQWVTKKNIDTKMKSQLYLALGKEGQNCLYTKSLEKENLT